MENFHSPRYLGDNGPRIIATPSNDPNDPYYQKTYTKTLGQDGVFYEVTYRTQFDGGEVEVSRIKTN